MQLETNKTYVDGNGRLVTIVGTQEGDFPCVGRFCDNSLAYETYAISGRCALTRNKGDLVAEANTEGGSAHEKCRSPYCECDEGKCREGKVDARGEAAAALLAKPDPIPHADLIRAVLDGKTVQRSVASIRGGEQTWDNVDYEDPRLAIKELLTPPTEWIKFRLKPEPIVRWCVMQSSSGYATKPAGIANVIRVEFDPNTHKIISSSFVEES